jgi:hypothetical protein
MGEPGNFTVAFEVHNFFKGATYCDLVRLWSAVASLRNASARRVGATSGGKAKCRLPLALFLNTERESSVNPPAGMSTLPEGQRRRRGRRRAGAGSSPAQTRAGFPRAAHRPQRPVSLPCRQDALPPTRCLLSGNDFLLRRLRDLAAQLPTDIPAIRAGGC